MIIFGGQNGYYNSVDCYKVVEINKTCDVITIEIHNNNKDNMSGWIYPRLGNGFYLNVVLWKTKNSTLDLE